MQPDSEHFTVLEMVSRFSGFKRYGGVMPLHLLAHNEDIVEGLLHNDILTLRSARPRGGYQIEGVCLTDLGRRLLGTR